MFEDQFRKFAHKVSMWVGSPSVFAVALGSVVVWAICGPIFEYSEGWQLTINTATTIITFLMVFIIQNTQNRDGRAIQIKLDELIRVTKAARNQLLDIEEMSETELNQVQQEFYELHQKAMHHLRRRRSERGLN